MKRATAIHNVQRIADRLRGWNGLICTPGTRHEAVRVRRAWVFGSTVHGSDTPNDVDILLEYEAVGRVYRPGKWRGWPRSNARMNREYRRRYGMTFAVSSEDTALKTIRKNLKRVSLHDYSVDMTVATPRVLIYPRNDFAGAV